MSSAAYETEWESAALPELESEFEGEFESESEFESEAEWEWEGEFEVEGESETEAFFGRLAALARRAARSPALRRIGLTAARAALRGLGDLGPGIGQVAGQIGSLLPEREGEFEAVTRREMFANPLRRVYPDAMMEHFGHAAASARTEAESEAFLGALIPLAARLIPRVAPTVLRAAPGLVRGIAGVGRVLYRSPTTRPLIRALPTVVRGTAASLARQVASGQTITPQTAVRTLAGQTARVLSNPRLTTQAYRRSRALDRRFHQVTRTPVRPRAPRIPTINPALTLPGVSPARRSCPMCSCGNR